MVDKLRGRQIIPSPYLCADQLATKAANPSPGTGVALRNHGNAPLIKDITLDLTAFNIAIDADDDYGGTKLCDLPTNALAILGASLDGAATVDGTGIVAATDISLALGTAVAASDDLSNAGEQNVIDDFAIAEDALERDFARHSAQNASPAALVLASGAKALYINALATLTGDGEIDITGVARLFYVDLGVVA